MPGYREDGKEQVVREAAPDSRFIPYYCSGDLHFDTLYLNKNNKKKSSHPPLSLFELLQMCLRVWEGVYT